MSTYRVDRSYNWNYQRGPSFEGSFPQVPETPAKSFFGHTVHSRVGIAAGLLLNAKWIRTYARLGYDILTYKTVRSRARACYPLPNWIFIDHEGPLDPRRRDEVLVRARRRPRDPAKVTGSVSFGMPSKAPEVWMADIGEARRVLGAGQVLVVSVVASPGPGDRAADMVSEFARLAGMAAEAGAQVVEANLSCPNVVTAEADIYLEPGLSRRVAGEIRQAVGGVPVTLKAGYFEDRDTLEKFLHAVDGLADGVVLVNAISRRIVNPDGTPAFGPGREVAGIIGRTIHDPCLRNVADAVEIVGRDQLSLRVLAVGGVMTEHDAAAYFDAGAYAVLMGGAPMFDPMLAVRMKAAHPEW